MFHLLMEDITPVVTVLVKVSGLPTATTHSPGFISDEEASFKIGNPI